MSEKIITSKDAMEYLVETGRKLEEIKVIEIAGSTYATKHLTRYEKNDPARPLHFECYTLTGLVEYLKSDIDGHFAKHGKLTVDVSSPTKVGVYSPIYGDENRRDFLATCSFGYSNIDFAKYMDTESFMIMLMTRFVKDDNRDNVLKLAGNLRQEQSAKVADDGFSQRVTVKTGLATESDVVVTNPVYLAPMRTFPEVEQPESPFVLRFREGPQAALFEADGGAWKLDAVRSVGAWLKGELEDLNVYIIS